MRLMVHQKPPESVLWGVDFTSAPGPRKPITVARGRMHGHVVVLAGVEALPDWASFEAWIAQPGPWVGGFDFPLGLPRVFVEDLQLGHTAAQVIQSLRRRCPQRMDFRSLVDQWGQGRPPGHRLVHRRADTSLPGVTSTSPLQTRYVPVGFMYYEGLWRLLQSGVSLPRLHQADPQRIALEAYPGLLAHQLIGPRSYKNQDSPDRLMARKDLLERLEQGHPFGVRLKMTHAQRDALAHEVSADRLDAVLCLMQTAWAVGQTDYGLPVDVDPVEGWILTA